VQTAQIRLTASISVNHTVQCHPPGLQRTASTIFSIQLIAAPSNHVCLPNGRHRCDPQVIADIFMCDTRRQRYSAIFEILARKITGVSSILVSQQRSLHRCDPLNVVDNSICCSCHQHHSFNFAFFQGQLWASTHSRAFMDRSASNSRRAAKWMASL
jgi:hypothetical protein